MLRFVVRRLAQMIPILLGLSVLLFAWVRALPGGPAAALANDTTTPEQFAEINRSLGLDRPVYIQYLEFLNRAVHLNFGNSLQTNRPVVDEMLDRFPASIELGVSAMIFAVVIGIPLGYVAARHYGSKLDHVSVLGSLLGITIPVFFLAYLLKYVFAVKLGWLPTTGRLDPRLTMEHPTGFYVLDGLVTGNVQGSWDAIKHLVLPAIALGTIPLAIVTRITRAAVLDVVNEDYVRTAEAKGMLRGTVTRRHVMRNALVPIVTILGLLLGLLMSGTVLTEIVFSFSGVGRFVATAIFARDYAVIQGFILVIAVLFVIVNLLVDITYGLIDPRMRVK